MTVSIGVCVVSHEGEVTPHEVAAATENAGLDALFVPENSHVPLARPGTIRQFDGIERLARFHDPFVTLGACAAVTQRIRLGTGVCLMTQRDPWVTANAVASLDRIAPGRIIVGVAGGFIRESMEDFGSSFRQRWKIVRERVEAMRCVWRDTQPEYSGEFAILDGSRPGVACSRESGPPVWIGSNSKTVPTRVARYADGWITVHESYPGDPLSDLKRVCDEQGRDFSDLTVALLNGPDDYDGAMRMLERGYHELHYFVGGSAGDGALADLERVAVLAERLRAAA